MNTIRGNSSTSVELKTGESMTVTVPSGSRGYYVKLPMQSNSGFTNFSTGSNTIGPFQNIERFNLFCVAGEISYVTGQLMNVLDVGGTVNSLTGMVEILNPETGVALYAASVSSGTPVSIAGDGASKDFAAYTIPAGSVKPNQHARITALFKKTGAVGGNFAGVYIGGQLLLQAFPGGTTMRYALEIDVFVNSTATGLTIMNVNAFQITTSGPLQTTTTESATSVSVDFSANQVFAIKGFAQAGEVQTLLGFSMEWTR